MIDFEKKSYLYKQELFNVKSDLCDLETDVLEIIHSEVINQEVGSELLEKIKKLIEEICDSFAEIERPKNL